MTAFHVRKIVNTFEVTPTLDTNAYSSGDHFAGPFELERVYTQGWGDQCILSSIQILDKAKQNADYDFLFFGQEPEVDSSLNSSIDISDSEISKLVGSVSVRSCSDTYIETANSSCLTMSGIKLEMTRARNSNGDQIASPNIWCVVIIRSSGTFMANDVRFTFGFELL